MQNFFACGRQAETVVIARPLLLGRAAVLVAFVFALLGPRLLLVPKIVGVQIMLLPVMAFAHVALPGRSRCIGIGLLRSKLHTASSSVEQQVRLKTRKIRSGRLPEFSYGTVYVQLEDGSHCARANMQLH